MKAPSLASPSRLRARIVPKTILDELGLRGAASGLVRSAAHLLRVNCQMASESHILTQ